MRGSTYTSAALIINNKLWEKSSIKKSYNRRGACIHQVYLSTDDKQVIESTISKKEQLKMSSYLSLAFILNDRLKCIKT